MESPPQTAKPGKGACLHSKGRCYICVVVSLLLAAIATALFSTNRLVVHKPRRVIYIVGVIVSGIAISILMLCLRFASSVKTKEDLKRALNARERDLEADAEFLKTLAGLPTRFTLKALESATENFSKKLGRGGFGSVYEGTLSDGCKVAVKRLERQGAGQKEFCAEVATISRVRHLNLVCLKGFCAEGAQRLLVYEYMPRGSLDRWIFQEKAADWSAAALDVLSWETRYNIALETARGLAYLHEECEERILHLDVKPQNILLDELFTAKVSDFGLSRSMDRGQSRLLTTMRGTPGYLAPEWLTQAGIDNKTDVYSYGIVVLELVSGRKSVDQSQSNPDHWFLPTMAFKKMEQQLVMDLVDPLLYGKLDDKACKQAVMMVSIALWCIQEDASMRPKMSSVVHMLEGIIPVEKPPVSNPLVSKAFLLDLSQVSTSTVAEVETLTLPR